MKAGLFKLRFDNLADQRQNLWLSFEHPGLRASALHELYR